jgi:hypothetical protein
VSMREAHGENSVLGDSGVQPFLLVEAVIPVPVE